MATLTLRKNPAGPVRFYVSHPVVNGTVVHTSDLEEWDDCPACVFSQVHLVQDVMICLDNCGFVSAPNL